MEQAQGHALSGAEVTDKDGPPTEEAGRGALGEWWGKDRAGDGSEAAKARGWTSPGHKRASNPAARS